MDQFLQQAKGTQPTADRSAKQHPESQKQACHIEAEMEFRRTVYRLHGSNRTGKTGRRTRVTIQSGITEIFPFARIYFSALKIQQMYIGTAKGNDLQQFTFQRV